MIYNFEGIIVINILSHSVKKEKELSLRRYFILKSLQILCAFYQKRFIYFIIQNLDIYLIKNRKILITTPPRSIYIRFMCYDQIMHAQRLQN